MKKVISQSLIGIVTGTFIGMTLSLVFSALNHSNQYYPSSPEFVSHFSGSLTATAASVVIWSLMGIEFSLGSLIFTHTDWSIVKMTIVHLFITYFGFLPLAALSGWFPLKFLWILVFTLIFLFVYLIIYTIMRSVARKDINDINHYLGKQ